MTQKEKIEKQLNETIFYPIKEEVEKMVDIEKKGQIISELNKVGFFYSCSRLTALEVAFELGKIVQKYGLKFQPTIEHKD